jgi:hypothetical protein
MSSGSKENGMVVVVRMEDRMVVRKYNGGGRWVVRNLSALF